MQKTEEGRDGSGRRKCGELVFYVIQRVCAEIASARKKMTFRVRTQQLKSRVTSHLESGNILVVTNNSGLVDRLTALAELMHLQGGFQRTRGRLLAIHFAWEPNNLCDLTLNQLQLKPFAKHQIHFTDPDPAAMCVAGSGQMASTLGFPLSYLWSLELLHRYSNEFRTALGMAESSSQVKRIGIHLRATDFWKHPATKRLKQMGVNDSNFTAHGVDILMSDGRFQVLSKQLPIVIFGDDLAHVTNFVSLLKERGCDADAANLAKSVTPSSFGFRTTSPELALNDLRRLAECQVIVKTFGRFALGAAAMGFTETILKIDFAERQVLNVTESLFQGKDSSCLD